VVLPQIFPLLKSRCPTLTTKQQLYRTCQKWKINGTLVQNEKATMQRPEVREGDTVGTKTAYAGKDL